MNVATLIAILGIYPTVIGLTIWLINRTDALDAKLSDKIDSVDAKIESLERSVHADFVEHLRREHKMGG